MFDLHVFLLFMAGALALNLAPGPDMTFVLAQAAHRGTRAGLAAALGRCWRRSGWRPCSPPGRSPSTLCAMRAQHIWFGSQSAWFAIRRI
jgi:hypothetical protein